MDSNLSTAVVSASGSLIVAIVAILTNNKRIDDLGKRMDLHFVAMEKLFTEKLLRVEQVMDARIKHLEDQH
jgi:predicted amino acid racemase